MTPDVQTVSVLSGENTLSWSINRDWAALGGGASIVDFNGDDASAFGCGPSAIFDQSQGSGWSTDAVLINPEDHADVDPRWVILELPVAVDVADIQINPSGTCGDGLSASTGKYSVETSKDGSTWQLATTPGAAFGAASRGRMNSISLEPSDPRGRQVRSLHHARHAAPCALAEPPVPGRSAPVTSSTPSSSRSTGRRAERSDQPRGRLKGGDPGVRPGSRSWPGTWSSLTPTTLLLGRLSRISRPAHLGCRASWAISSAVSSGVVLGSTGCRRRDAGQPAAGGPRGAKAHDRQVAVGGLREQPGIPASLAPVGPRSTHFAKARCIPRK